MTRLLIVVFSLSLGLIAATAEPPVLQHNPFVRPDLGGAISESASAAVTQQLRATLIDGGNALANIDGKLVAVGDTVDNATVIDIDEGRVTLERDGSRYTLELVDRIKDKDED